MSELLLPAERMALTVASEQVGRGESPTQNIAAVVVWALERLANAVPVPWCETHDLPLMYDKDRCNRSPNPMRHNCRMPIEPQVFKIETDDE